MTGTIDLESNNDIKDYIFDYIHLSGDVHAKSLQFVLRYIKNYVSGSVSKLSPLNK